MQHILCVGADPSLLYTRSMVLERSGALVTSTTARAGLALVKESTFDLLVLCHSIQNEDLRFLCREVRARCSSVKMLLVEAPGSPRLGLAGIDRRFALEDGPQQLVAAVRELLSADKKVMLAKRTPAMVLPAVAQG